MYWLLERSSSWVFGECTNNNDLWYAKNSHLMGLKFSDTIIRISLGEVNGDVTSNDGPSGMTRTNKMTGLPMGSLFIICGNQPSFPGR